MATLRAASGLSARLLRQVVRANDAHIIRGFSHSVRCPAAQNFTMPALSPTMTEGNIATWRVAEGASYSAGDVLLEIETDKATMDVEAQEDGIMMRIMQGDGAKAVQVGTRIAVIAEPGDDLDTLELPPDEAAQAEGNGQQQQQKGQEQQGTGVQKERRKGVVGSNTSSKTYQQQYPLMPSVALLVKQNGLDDAVVNSITPTGPSGRLLKGDVLAYLGAIDAQRPAAVSVFLDKLSRLDLSNIVLAKKPAAAPAAGAAKPAEKKPAPPAFETVSREISLQDVRRLQRAIGRRLREEVPIDALIRRAVAIANEELPAEPLPRDLFDDILGLAPKKPAATTTRGSYLPVITHGLPKEAAVSPAHAPRGGVVDIIDILAGTATAHAKPTSQPQAGSETTITTLNSSSLFELKVKSGEVKRANVFLTRLEDVLTKQPGSLLVSQ